MLVLAMAGSVLAVPAVSIGDTVRIKATANRTWNPAFKQVVKGTKVVWKNPTDSKHTVTSYSANWSKNVALLAGERTAKTFRRTGAYYYRCKIHSSLTDGTCSGMCGHVHVTSS
jgi:plastocyanin